MAGIYIHIPFCRVACHYCNFFFSTTLQLKNEVVDAILREIELTPGKRNDSIETIYFGGGTPSLLTTGQLQKVLDTLKAMFSISESAEITLEANPDDINPQIAEEWRRMGINRLSIGIQSFHDADLQWMNRAHNASQGLNSIDIIRDAGFANFSIDLIFGAPVTSMDDWKSNVSRAIHLKIPHISSYALTVEPATALDKMIRQKKRKNTDADEQARQYEYLMDAMAAAGYDHYEISNFSLPGMHSRHNSSYWKGIPYFGFGPGAHSFDGSQRKWNISSNPAYIKSINQGIIPSESEQITPVKKMNEYIMTSLRTASGIDLLHFVNSFGEEKLEQLIKGFDTSIHYGHAILNNQQFYLTREGKLFADGIAADLFFSE